MKEEYYCIPVIQVGDLIHTEENPFCDDPDCPCHNMAAVDEHITPRLDDGTMSNNEAFRFYFGK